jgi:hypothetical protein|tara:strand:+ start:134 stop:343 length:210 start_codon:yes stop_codon:yes gene_type:complete
MNLREDVLEMINNDLRMMVNLNIFDADDHIARMDFARSLKLPELVVYMGKTHTEVLAYMLDFDVYQDAA